MNILENSIVKLRAPEPEDLESLYKWENNTNLWHISDTNEPLSKYQIKEYIAHSNKDIYEKKQLRLMIESKNASQTIGCIDLYNFDPIHQRAYIGIVIDENHQQKGFAFEALKLLKQYANNYLHLHQLCCYIPINNTPSVQLFQKANFKKQGQLKDWLKISNNCYADVLLLSFIFE